MRPPGSRTTFALALAAVLAAGCGADERLRLGAALTLNAAFDGGGVELRAVLAVPAAGTVTFRVYQAATGIRVRTIEAVVEGGRARAIWNGHDENGRLLPPDAYHVGAVAKVSTGLAPTEFSSFTTCGERGCSFGSTEHVCDWVGWAGDPDDPERAPWNDPAGGNATSPHVAGIDLGAPIEHAGKLHYLFGDTIELAGNAGLLPLGEPQRFPLGLAPGNDDAAGALRDPIALLRAPSRETCPDLDLFRTPENRAATVSFDGPYDVDGTGGSFLGAVFVGGGGFSMGGHLYAIMPDGRGVCETGRACDHFLFFENCGADGDCLDEGDRCLGHSALPGRGFCFYGPDCDAPGAPESTERRECHPRRKRALLATSPDANERFESVTLDNAAPELVGRSLYDGKFAVASFAVHDGRAYVFGRERAVGSEREPANVYLAVHDGDGGRVRAPRYFAGCRGACGEDTDFDDVVWSADARAAAPLYIESRVIAGQPDVSWVPELGLFVMLHGGRIPGSFIELPSRIWRFSYPVLDPEENARETVGIGLRTAPHPWGPWSEAATVYSPWQRQGSGYCEIMHYAGANDPDVPDDPPPHLGCDEARNATLDFGHGDHGAEYGAAQIAPLSASFGETGATIYWLMSTWNPYRIVIMKTDLDQVPLVLPAQREALEEDLGR